MVSPVKFTSTTSAGGGGAGGAALAAVDAIAAASMSTTARMTFMIDFPASQARAAPACVPSIDVFGPLPPCDDPGLLYHGHVADAS